VAEADGASRHVHDDHRSNGGGNGAEEHPIRDVAAARGANRSAGNLPLALHASHDHRRNLPGEP